MIIMMFLGSTFYGEGISNKPFYSKLCLKMYSISLLPSEFLVFLFIVVLADHVTQFLHNVCNREVMKLSNDDHP